MVAGGTISGSPQSATSSSSSSATLTLNKTGSGKPLEEELTSGDAGEDSGSVATPVELHMNADGRKYTAEEMLQIWEHMKNANHFKSSGKSRSELYYSVIPNNPANVLDAQRKSGDHHHHHHRNNHHHHHHNHSRHQHQHQHHQSTGSNGSNSQQNDASSVSPPAQPQGQPQPQSSSLLSSTTTATTTSSAWSPFRASGPTILQSNGSGTELSSLLQKPGTPTGGGMFAAAPNARPPPGLGGMAPPGLATLLPPETINWNYRDGAGNEHGPFNGRMMHEWFLGGWLQEDLLIRRSEESEFTTLKDLKLKLGNFTDPFLIPLPPVPQQQNRPLYQPLPQQFAGLQLNQQPMAAGMAGPWGSHPLPSAGGTISPWDHHQQPFFSGAPMVNHQHPQSGGSLVDENLWPRASPQTPPIQPKASALLNQNASTIDPASAEIARQETPPVGTPKEKTVIHPPQPQQDLESNPEPQPQPRRESKPTKEEKQRPTEKVVEPEVVTQEHVAEEKAVSPPPEEQATTVEAVPKQVQEESAEIVEYTLEEEEQLESPKPILSPAKPPPTAPWAKKDSKPAAPSLKEIQEREAAERKNKAAQKQQLQQKQLQQATAAAAAAEAKNGPTLPSGATWAHASATPAAPPKTLAQIQKEEEEARKKAAAAAATVPTASAVAPAGKKYSDIVSPSTSRLASAPAPAPAPAPQAMATNGGSAWTTVGPGGKKATGPPPAPVAAATPRPAAAPAAKRVATPTTATAKPQKQTSGDEFLQWCKSSIHDLNAGVNQQEMLSILLSLPATPDSKEIIADTIYSNSSTMDGRRFAEEFLKRRKAADAENTSNGETWSEILQRNTNTNKPTNDGWNSSFKVVGGKKKNRKAID